MKSNFEERKAKRLEAYQNLAAKNEQKSEELFDQSKQLGGMIPFGQPILVGHHSEKGHRSHIKKIHNKMDQSCKASAKAKYYEGRAESLMNNKAIFSDDPNAIDKLQEKLDRLEAAQELMKDINKILSSRKIPNRLQKFDAIKALGLSDQTTNRLLLEGGFERWRLSNQGAVIRATKERIKHLENIAAISSSEEEINGCTLKISSEDNRVQIFFPGKPEEKIRKELKSHGFHWSPSVGAWIRQISNQSIYWGKKILESLKPAQ